MNRIVTWSLAFCLCLFAEQVNAQGLLGKPNVSAQYLLLRVGDQFDGVNSDLGHGGRLQASVPLVAPDSEAAWGAGLDGFGTISGLGFEIRNPFDPSISADIDLWSGDVGLNYYMRATENVRPFLQFGINWNQAQAEYSNGSSLKTSDTSMILAAGLEVDVFPFAAVRASYGRDADGFGARFSSAAFLGEVILRPGDHWFGRISASVGNDKTVVGGFGAGYAW